MVAYLWLAILYLAGALLMLTTQSWRSLGWRVAGSIGLIAGLYFLCARADVLFVIALAIVMTPIGIGLIAGIVTRAVLLTVGRRNPYLSAAIVLVGLAAYPGFVSAKIYSVTLSKEQLADRARLRSQPVQFPACEAFRKSIYLHDVILRPDRHLGTQVSLRWPDELDFYDRSPSIPKPHPPQRQSSLEVALPYPPAAKGHVSMTIAFGPSLQQILTARLRRSSPGKVTLPEASAGGLKKIASQWSDDVFAAAKNGEWTDVITCNAIASVPFPHCHHFIRDRNIEVRLRYPRPLLTDWERIRAAAQEFMNCADMADGFRGIDPESGSQNHQIRRK